jgi:hypothetical protein
MPSGFDICLMPWALIDAPRTISPTKTLEYMASGKPIVSTAVGDVVRDHGDLVHVAGDRTGSVELALTVLGRHDPARRGPAVDRLMANRRRNSSSGRNEELNRSSAFPGRTTRHQPVSRRKTP